MLKKMAAALACLAMAVFTLFGLTGCSGGVGAYDINTKTVMTIGGKAVSYDLYKHFFYQGMTQLGGDDVDWSSPENQNKLKSEVEQVLRRMYALKLLCDKYDIKLSKDDKKQLDAVIGEYIAEEDGEAGYRLWLSENRISGNVFRDQLAQMYFYDVYLRDLLFTGIDNLIKMDDATVRKDIDENFYRYTQIFVAFDGDDKHDENRKEIDKALAELKRGADFAEVAGKYSDWMVNVNVGAYCAKGQKILEIEETALALENGEYSEVVESSEGYHIIMRLPMEESYINDYFDDLAYVSANRRYNELLDNMAPELEVVYNKYYDTLTFEQLIAPEYPK